MVGMVAVKYWEFLLIYFSWTSIVVGLQKKLSRLFFFWLTEYYYHLLLYFFLFYVIWRKKPTSFLRIMKEIIVCSGHPAVASRSRSTWKEIESNAACGKRQKSARSSVRILEWVKNLRSRIFKCSAALGTRVACILQIGPILVHLNT